LTQNKPKRQRKKAEAVENKASILSEAEKEYFVSHEELFGRFILIDTTSGLQFRGAAFQYSELNKRYEEYLEYYMTDEKGHYAFIMEDTISTIYVPSEVIDRTILFVEMIVPTPVKH
jgi:hypothetical protein